MINDSKVTSINNLFEMLNDNQINYWLDAGTLLKGVRDRDFLNSSDIDLAIKWEDHNKVIALKSQLIESGYEVVIQNSLPFLEDIYTIILPKAINQIRSVDIYIYHQFEDEWVRRSIHKPLINHYSRHIYFLAKRLLIHEKYEGGFSKLLYIIPFKLRFTLGRLIFKIYERYGKTNWFVVPDRFFAEFTRIKIYGISFVIPKLSEDYLKYRYGESWRIPIKRELWCMKWKNSETKFLQQRKLMHFDNFERHWLSK